ncbi:Major facilitator iron-regulated transporter B [Saitozyma sp. JCM 24511]|nr:Major facilitator iron-regulated transporter B [Saitozyma sp. JCM 24511]
MKVDQAVNLAEVTAQPDRERGEQNTLPNSTGQSSKDDFGSDDLPALPQASSVAANQDASAEDIHSGVRQAEAITQTWSKSSLRTIYLFLWLTYAVNAFQSSITGNLTAYVTSGFAEHSLIPVISIVSNVMSAVAYMVLAQILNLWDRSYGYLAMTVFYSIGFSGMIFAVDVLTADTSRLKDRGLEYAFTASPWIITAYAGPAISERFYDSNWRWAFGAFAIILPFVGIPMFVFLQHQKRRATESRNLKANSNTRRTWMAATIHYLVEFDVVGIVLICAGMILFLLPFSIATSTADSWRSASIIAMLVIGVACLVGFVVFERYFSPRPFIPYHLLVSRTVLGACMLKFTWQIAYYCWASYFTSYLQVVYDLSISEAGYIASIYDVVASVWLFPVGYLIRWTGYFKWVVLLGVPLYTLGEGLMIYFRKPGDSVGWIVFTQILIALGGAAFTLVEQVAVLAAGSHNDSASILALLGLFGYFGGAVGNSVSGAIWTNTLPTYQQELLPSDTVDDWEDIYNSLDVQLSYPIGDPTRTAISLAYAEAQSRMLIAGTAIMARSSRTSRCRRSSK